MNIFRLILIPMTFFFLFTEVPLVSSEEIPALLEQGTRLLQEKKMDEALQIFQQVIQAAPDRPEGYFYSAIAYHQLGRLPEGLEAIEKAVSLSPERPTYLFRMGLILEGMGKSPEAAETYLLLIEKGEKLSPKDPEFERVIPTARRRLQKLQIDKYLQTAEAFYREGKYEVALQELQAALSLEPGNPFVHYGLGLNQSKLQKDSEALRSFQEAVRVKPSYADAHFQIGLTAERLRLYDVAHDEYKKFLELAPNFPQAGAALEGVQRMQAALNLSVRFEAVANAIRSELWDDALKENEALEVLQPGNPFVHYNFGIILSHLGRNEEAVSRLKKALEMDPRYRGAHYQLGLVYDDMGLIPEALTSYEAFLQGAPAQDDEKTQKVRERVDLLRSDLEKREQAKEVVEGVREAFEKKDVEGAIRNAEVLRALDESDFKIHLVLGRLYMDAGRVEEAAAAFERAVTLDPNQTDGWWMLGNVSETLKRLDRAIAAYETVSRLEPESLKGKTALAIAKDLRIRNHFERAKLSREKGNLDESLQEIQSVLRIAPDNPVAYFNAGVLYDRLDQPEKALFMLQKAVSLVPDYVPAYLQVGLVLEGMNRFREAGAFYLKVLEIEKTGDAVQFARKRLLTTTEMARFEVGLRDILDRLNKKDLQGARKSVETLLVHQPRNYQLYQILGTIYRQELRYEEAAAAYRKSLEINPSYALSYLTLGDTLYDMLRFAEAREAFEKAIESGKGTREGDLAKIHLQRLRSWRGSFSLAHAVSSNVSYGVHSDPDASTSYNMGLSYYLLQEKKYQASVVGSVSQALYYRSQVKSMGLSPSLNLVFRPRENWTLSFAATYSRGYVEQAYVSFSKSFSLNLGMTSQTGFPSGLSLGYSLSFPHSLRSPKGDANQQSMSVNWSQGLGGLYGMGGGYSFTVNRNLHPEGSNYGFHSHSANLGLSRILFPQVPLTLSYGFNLTQYMNPDSTSLFLQYRRSLQHNVGLSLSAPISDRVSFAVSYQYVDNETNLPRPTAELQQTLEDILATPIPTVGGGYTSQSVTLSFSVSF